MLHNAEEVKKWIPGIKKELDYYLEVGKLLVRSSTVVSLVVVIFNFKKLGPLA